ncbi:MAG: hypothetical protein K0Q43_207 [Ramlibacter sp.]|nr:hypothetical protein [Ramlibacter sp.]
MSNSPGAFNRSTVSKVQDAIARLQGTSTGDLAQGLGRVVVTTSAAASGSAYSSRYLSVLNSLSQGDGFRAMLAERRAALQRSIEQIGDVGECAIVKHTKGNRWLMILRDASAQGNWRTQAFDVQGFSGHETYATREQAIEIAAGRGFTQRDDQALDRLQDTEAFQRGLYAADLIQQHAAGAIGLEELHRRLAVFDETSMALRTISNATTAAFWAPASDTIYMLADRIEEGAEESVYLHEVMHKHGRATLGQFGWDRLTGGVKAWERAPSPSIERLIHFVAHARASKAVGTANAALYDEELFAYAVEEAVRRGVKPSARAEEGSAQAWLAQVDKTLRAVIEQISGATPAALSAQQMVDLSYALAQLENPARAPLIKQALGAQLQELQRFIKRDGNPHWYSPLLGQVTALPGRAQTSGHWLRWLAGLKRRGVSPNEIEWSGLPEWLALQSDKVTPDQVRDFLGVNGVSVQEVSYGGEHANNELDELIVRMTTFGFHVERDMTSGIGSILRNSDGASFDWDDEADTFVCAESEERVPSQVDRIAREIGNIVDSRGDSETVVPEAGGTRYSKYAIPGGENYRELLLTLPGRGEGDDPAVKRLADLEAKRAQGALSEADWKELEQLRAETGLHSPAAVFAAAGEYRTTHWTERNVLAHIRFDERRDADGRRVLFVHEIQSDWAQEGKKQGFDTAEAKATRAELEREADALRAEANEIQKTPYEKQSPEQGRRLHEVQLRLAQIRETKPLRTNVPVAPFVGATDAWVTLAIKRLVKLAVDEGFERVAIISGEQAADLYGLRKEVDSLTVWGDAREGYYFEARRARVVVVADRGTPLSGEQLADYLGADMASRAITDIAAGRAAQYDGTNLNVGGGGMIAFYNRIVPRVARDVVRKLGGAGLVQAGVSTDESTEPWRVVGEAGQVLAVARTQGQALDWLKWNGQLPWATGARAARIGDGAPQIAFDINPGMRAAASAGLPLFSQVAADALVRPLHGWSEDVETAEAVPAEAG